LQPESQQEYKNMEAVAYILVLALAIGTIFFAIAFREPPRIENKEEK